ncbi:MAG: amino acid adenylation domain-containing protein [Magnetospirillum sp.]|nr:amino acid adenylation domain-containing protein [Magnetospirillum sp.]
MRVSPPACRLIGPRRPDHLRNETLHAIFAATAAASPDKVAIIFGSRRVAYGELAARSDAVAQALRARGLGRGSFIGLWLDRSIDLHVALLGILKAGAAYIPFDADTPVDRVAACLADCSAAAVLVDRTTAARAGTLPAPMLFAGALAAETPRPASGAAAGMDSGSQDPAYAIYTSGSTGRPKAVAIGHRNICHYLRAANEIYGLVAEDVVFQGASVAFDLSLEEIFLPYLAGATLWVAGRETMQATDRLCNVLDEAGITVLDTVPTLLALLPRDVPSLRVVILGGEACPPAVAERWCRPGRRLFNSYGPTETTVVATVAEIRPGEPVTIGRPIANHTCHVVDEDLRPVAPGATGELLIGGPGVAGGYLGRPELTRAKFIANPFAAGGDDPVLYRSGDAVSIDPEGRLIFHGRIDDQVKIRGFRVELGEIETRLSASTDIAAPAVVLRNDGGIDRLVAFLVPAQGATVDVASVRARLRAELPCYMVPSHFETADALPRLASGKIDRKALRALPLSAAPAGDDEEPAGATEAALLAAAKRVFPGQAIPLDADFFLDLGGHSLLAARFVSAARETPDLAGLTLQDIYGARSLRAMAQRLEAAGKAQPPRSLAFTPPPLARRFLCGLAQAAVLPVIIALATAPWLGVFVSYMLLSGDDAGFLKEVGTLLATYSVINLGTVAIAVAGKWLVLGRTRPGRYPLWGAYYFRWWLTQRLLTLVHVKWFQDTVIMRVYLRLLGAGIGRDCVIGEIDAGAVDLISIGRDATIGGRVHFANAEVVGNELLIGPVLIGERASIGSSAVLNRGCVVGGGAQLGDLTALPAGTVVGAFERWDGSPGRHVGTVGADDLPAPPAAGPLRRTAMGLAYALSLLVFPPITLIPIFPAFAVFDHLDGIVSRYLSVGELYTLPVLAWPTAMVLIVLTVLLIAAIRWAILPRVTAGTYSVHGWFYLRKWMVALCSELTLETLSSLYATVYMRAWYRLMGARIGRGSEISCSLSGRYDLIDIGDKCFVADEVMLGDETVRCGWMALEPVRTGDRVFIGNEAVVPGGADIPAGALIGIKSKPPANDAMAEGGTWFGSPPIKLPVRQQFGDVGATWTYEPPRWRIAARAVFEALSVSLPSMLFITFGTLAVDLLAPAVLARDYARAVPQFLSASVAISVALALSSAAVKWLMMGVYRPTTKPMWSWWALRTESVAVMYWGMAGKVLLDHLRGTPFLPWALRIYGARTGRGVFMDTTDITEFDCVSIGDFAAINSAAALQTHLYEDRVMKVGRVAVGTGVSVGAAATVLYDTKVGDFARIGPLTIVMKGEDIPAHTSWHGAPAAPCPPPPAEMHAAAETVPDVGSGVAVCGRL